MRARVRETSLLPPKRYMGTIAIRAPGCLLAFGSDKSYTQREGERVREREKERGGGEGGREGGREGGWVGL